MSISPYNYRGSPPSKPHSTALANWDDWGRKRCDEASVIGLTMVGGSIIAKNPNLAKAGVALTIIPQFIKAIFLPREGKDN